MIKPIILVMSCKRDQDNGCNYICRQTWIKEWAGLIDYQFFVGAGCKQTADDEIVLDVADSYNMMVAKLQLALKWALEKQYTHFFKCDTDTWIHVPRLLSSGFEKNSYIGAFTGSYAHGGAGYWLDIAAARLVVNARFDTGGGEDCLVGGIVRHLGWVSDNRYSRSPKMESDGITAHLLRTKEGWGPPEMISFHEKMMGRSN